MDGKILLLSILCLSILDEGHVKGSLYQRENDLCPSHRWSQNSARKDHSYVTITHIAQFEKSPSKSLRYINFYTYVDERLFINKQFNVHYNF